MNITGATPVHKRPNVNDARSVFLTTVFKKSAVVWDTARVLKYTGINIS